MGSFKNFLYSGLAALTILAGCSKDDSITPEKDNSDSTSDTISTSNSNPHLYDNVYELSSADLEKINYYDYSTVGFSSPRDYNVGDVLIGGISEETPYGILGKITYATPDKQSFKVDINTNLDDAIKDGEGSFSKDLAYSDVTSSSKAENPSLKSGQGNYNFHYDINEILYDADRDFSTTDDQMVLKGYIDFNVSADAKFKFNNHSLYANFETTFSGESEIEISTTLGTMNLEDKLSLKEYYFNPFVFAIGAVPVVVVPTVGLDFAYSVDVNSKASIKSFGDFYQNNSLTLENGIWSVTKSPENYFNFSSPKVSLDFDANLTASLLPHAALELYYAGGPFAGVESYINFSANTLKNPWWELIGGLNFNLGIDMSKISSNINNFEKTIPLEEILIGDAGEAFPGNYGVDSVVIQPGPEGKDAWVRKFGYPDCSESYASSGDDVVLKIDYEVPGGCDETNFQSLIQPPLSQIPLGAEITSAMLYLYGKPIANQTGVVPEFNFYKLNGPWDESTITWTTKPEGTLIAKEEFPEASASKWYSVDITPTVKEWCSNGDNYGLLINTSQNDVSANFKSSDNSEESLRPKLIVRYKQ